MINLDSDEDERNTPVKATAGREREEKADGLGDSGKWSEAVWSWVVLRAGVRNLSFSVMYTQSRPYLY